MAISFEDFKQETLQHMEGLSEVLEAELDDIIRSELFAKLGLKTQFIFDNSVRIPAGAMLEILKNNYTKTGWNVFGHTETNQPDEFTIWIINPENSRVQIVSSSDLIRFEHDMIHHSYVVSLTDFGYQVNYHRQEQ